MPFTALEVFRYCCSMSQYVTMITLRPPRVGQLHGRPELHAHDCPCSPHSTAQIYANLDFHCDLLWLQCWSVVLFHRVPWRAEEFSTSRACHLSASRYCSRRTPREIIRNSIKCFHIFQDNLHTCFNIFKSFSRSWTCHRGLACWNCPSETVIATCTETGPKARRNISWHSLT